MGEVVELIQVTVTKETLEYCIDLLGNYPMDKLFKLNKESFIQEVLKIHDDFIESLRNDNCRYSEVFINVFHKEFKFLDDYNRDDMATKASIYINEIINTSDVEPSIFRRKSFKDFGNGRAIMLIILTSYIVCEAGMYYFKENSFKKYYENLIK